MLNNLSRSVLVGGWAALLATAAGASIALGANLATTAFLLAVGAAAGVIAMVLLARSVPEPTMAEILNNVDSAGGRR